MALKLKPTKCRSLSLSGGSPKSIEFAIEEDSVPTVENESHKFLGSLITFRNTSADIFDYLSNKIQTALENVDSSLIRAEYKIQVYVRYVLPSLRFHLTVNDLCSTHLDTLDKISNRFIKKWFGIPHPGSLAFIFMPNGLNIKSISKLYLECHAITHISARLKGDKLVNHCLDSKIERENGWVRKKSIAVECENIYTNVKGSSEKPNTMKSMAKDLISNSIASFWKNHVQSLVVQGRFLELLSLESTCVHWRSIIFNLPERVCKFLVNSVTDSLNTRANLLRWGKSSTNKCSHCKNKETLNHVLNSCKVFLDQGRYTWRHNNILNYIIKVACAGFSKSEPSSPKFIHDIPGCPGYASGTTIPTECSPTNLIPDLCIYWKDSRKLVILELSVPFEMNIHSAHSYKSNKYAPLISDIQGNKFDVSYFAIEIGSRGFISQDNLARLKRFHSVINKPALLKLSETI
jgi:hypothetical protein